MDPKEVLAHYQEQEGALKEIQATREYYTSCNNCDKVDVCKYRSEVERIARIVAEPLPKACTLHDISFLDILVSVRVVCKYYARKKEEL